MKNLIDRKADEILLLRKQLSIRWGCCKETIKRMQNRGELPTIVFNGKNIRYRLSDVIKLSNRDTIAPLCWKMIPKMQILKGKSAWGRTSIIGIEMVT
ncbi:MAG: hypothetical protein LBC30_03910 [Puniceicoccales bacterium]|nr:hypothetical protein [Puniceicoccales bacterium]